MKRRDGSVSTIKHEATVKARARVLKVAKKRGYITNKQARAIGRWSQAWYHLDAMMRAGMLEKIGYNLWRPTKRAARQEVKR
jgi:hypothetical protein